jgi:hypothetical protein
MIKERAEFLLIPAMRGYKDRQKAWKRLHDPPPTIIIKEEPLPPPELGTQMTIA